MSSTIRYKFIRNDTGVVFTPTTFPIQYDGDDKQQKIIRRVITATDIGTADNQLGKTTGANAGLIMDVIPSTYNVLFVIPFSFSKLGAQSGMQVYQNFDSDVAPLPTPTTQAQLCFGWNQSDSTIRVIDKAQGGASAIVTGDVIIAIIYLGQPFDARDSMN